MKSILLSFACCFFACFAFGQKIEFAAFGYSGLSHYMGSYATSAASFSPTKSYPVTNPYGSKYKCSPVTNFGGQVQLITKFGFIGGLQLGLDNVNVNTRVDQYEKISNLQPAVPTDGYVKYHTQFLNFNPYIGYRIAGKKVNLDFMPGAEIGFKLQGRIEGKQHLTEPGYISMFDARWTDIATDVRAKISLTAYYNRFGLSASYARGLSNYAKNNTRANGEKAYTELLRFGIVCRVF